MITRVVFMSSVNPNEYNIVEILPTASQPEAIAKAERLLGNPEDWIWLYCTTEAELNERPINWEIGEDGEYLDDLTFQGGQPFDDTIPF